MKQLAFILVLVIALLTTSCHYITGEAPAQTPEPTPPPITSPAPPRTDWEPGSSPPAGIGGWEQPRPLSEDERAEAVKIALSSQSVSEWLQGRSDYRTGPVDWYAIIWDSNGEAGTWWSLDDDRIASEGVPEFVNPYAFWYPGVTIAVGEGTIYQMQIAVDMDSGKVVMVMGPYPSLSSPDRFKNMLPPPAGDWTTFTTDDGLAGNVVTSVTQDTQGVIWVGSTEGLTRYDGSHFEIYPDSLRNTHIVCAARDRQGNLWFGTYGEGVFKYTGKEWQNFTPGNTGKGLPGIAIKDILVDNQDNIWFATVGNVGQRTAPIDYGVTRYDGSNWTSFLDRTDVETIFQDSSGNLWFGTNVGVTRYDGSHWQTFTTEDGLADNYVVAITEDSQGHMWFGTWNDGTSRYDGKGWQTYNPEDGLETSAVHCTLNDSRGNLWFGSYSIDGYYGISLFDGTRWQHFDPWPGREVKYHYNVISIFEDNEGNIWFPTSIGLVRYRE